MTARLLLVAHGETLATREAVFSPAEGLAPRALASLSTMPERALRPRLVLKSPARAAGETAEALGWEAHLDEALRDLEVGRWSGHAFAEIAAAEPENVSTWICDPAYSGHGGESIDHLVQRTEQWLLHRHEAQGLTVAVTHAAVIRAALVATLGAPGSAFWRIDVAPLGTVAFSSNGRRWSLRALKPL